MLSIKFYHKKAERETIFNKTIDNIVKYLSNNLNLQKTKLTSDSNTIEIISGNTNILNDEQITTELIIKKVISIKKSDLENKEKLDKYIYEIKQFCSCAKEIENTEYLPLHMRKKE